MPHGLGSHDEKPPSTAGLFEGRPPSTSTTHSHGETTMHSAGDHSPGGGQYAAKHATDGHHGAQYAEAQQPSASHIGGEHLPTSMGHHGAPNGAAGYHLPTGAQYAAPQEPPESHNANARAPDGTGQYGSPRTMHRYDGALPAGARHAEPSANRSGGYYSPTSTDHYGPPTAPHRRHRTLPAGARDAASRHPAARYYTGGKQARASTHDAQQDDAAGEGYDEGEQRADGTYYRFFEGRDRERYYGSQRTTPGRGRRR